MTLLTILCSFILAHWLDMLVVVAFTGFMVWLWKRGKKETVKRILYGLVVRAEKQLGSKTGQEKKALVYSWLPWIIKLVWSQDDIDNFIKDAVKYLEKRLQTPGVTLLSYEEEQRMPAISNMFTISNIETDPGGK